MCSLPQHHFCGSYQTVFSWIQFIVYYQLEIKEYVHGISTINPGIVSGEALPRGSEVQRSATETHVVTLKLSASNYKINKNKVIKVCLK